MKKCVALVGILLLAVSVSNAQQQKAVTTSTSDPASVSLESLVSQADLVAFIEVLSGDSESYDQVIYKAKILKSYKGAKENDVFYFGPFRSYGVGSEYLVFLKRTTTTIGHLVSENSRNKPLAFDLNYVPYRVMYDGYSVMPVSFQCVFEEPKQCDYAVRFNIMQVLLPKTFPTFPLDKDESDVSQNKFVTRKAVETLLKTLSSRAK